MRGRRGRHAGAIYRQLVFIFAETQLTKNLFSKVLIRIVRTIAVLASGAPQVSALLTKSRLLPGPPSSDWFQETGKENYSLTGVKRGYSQLNAKFPLVVTKACPYRKAYAWAWGRHSFLFALHPHTSHFQGWQDLQVS